MKLKLSEYVDVIKKILDEHNVGLNIVLSDETNSLSFAPAELALKVNLMGVNSYINKKIHPNLSDKEVLYIMVCHELGHYREYFFELFFDPIKVKAEGTPLEEWNQFIIEREIGAWEYGKHFVPAHLLEEYNHLNERNLKAYKEKYPY